MSNYNSPNSLKNLNDEAENLTADLTKVKLYYFEGDNIDILKQCPNLEEIEIYAESSPYGRHNPDFTIDISVITQLPKLKKITITGCPIIDTIPLEQTTQLESIWIAGSEIDSIDFLKNYTHLTYLFINDINVKNIDVLENMTKLYYLHLSECKVESIKALSNLTSLTSLYLENNKINDFSPIYGLTQLEDLFLKGNKTNEYHKIPYVDQLDCKDFTVANYTDEQLQYWKDVFKSWAIDGKHLEAIEPIFLHLSEIHDEETQIRFVLEVAIMDGFPLHIVLSKTNNANPREINNHIPESVADVTKISSKISIGHVDYKNNFEFDIEDIKENDNKLHCATMGQHSTHLHWDISDSSEDKTAIIRNYGNERKHVEAKTLGQVIIAILAMMTERDDFDFEELAE